MTTLKEHELFLNVPLEFDYQRISGLASALRVRWSCKVGRTRWRELPITFLVATTNSYPDLTMVPYLRVFGGESCDFSGIVNGSVTAWELEDGWIACSKAVSTGMERWDS